MSILAAVHLAALTGPEQRVLGCLVEKRWTTPDQYPLSLNALRLACNQATNRDPVTDYDEATVRDAVQRLAPYGLTRLTSGHGSRTIKYRHLAEEGLGLDRPQLAVLCVLLLRGAQTPGELKSRSERLSPTTLGEVEQRLAELQQRGYARRLGRRPGQKEAPFQHLLGGEDAPELSFTDGQVDRGPGGELIAAMRRELALMYAGLDLDGAAMPKAGPAELGPPSGVFIVGWAGERPVCCGGVKWLPDGACEIKRMYVAPAWRGRGVARRLLSVLEDRARELGYTVLRLDTGPRQAGAQRLYESEGYVEVPNFNGNPVASFFGEKRVAPGPKDGEIR